MKRSARPRALPGSRAHLGATTELFKNDQSARDMGKYRRAAGITYEDLPRAWEESTHPTDGSPVSPLELGAHWQRMVTL